MRHRIWRVKDGNLTDRNGAWLPYITYYEPKSKEEIVGPVGRKMATEIMLDIAMYGGQHGMGGVCTVGHAYGDLNVGEINHDWDGEYPA